MDEDIAMEDAIWPWLASDCMAKDITKLPCYGGSATGSLQSMASFLLPLV